MGARVNQQSPVGRQMGSILFFSLGYVFSFGAKWGPFLFAGLWFFHLAPNGVHFFLLGYAFSFGARWGPFLFAGLCFFIQHQMGSISFCC
jgi:hypothetical protein